MMRRRDGRMRGWPCSRRTGLLSARLARLQRCGSTTEPAGDRATYSRYQSSRTAYSIRPARIPLPGCQERHRVSQGTFGGSLGGGAWRAGRRRDLVPCANGDRQPKTERAGMAIVACSTPESVGESRPGAARRSIRGTLRGMCVTSQLDAQRRPSTGNSICQANGHPFKASRSSPPPMAVARCGCVLAIGSFPVSARQNRRIRR